MSISPPTMTTGCGGTFRDDTECGDRSVQTARYFALLREVMAVMWGDPRNDQRPVIRSWLRSLVSVGQSVFDIGPGDGYYIPLLKPSRFRFVEPHQYFRTVTERRAKLLGIQEESFASVGAVPRGDLGRADLILMSHVLFYLEDLEIQRIADERDSADLIMIYPDPDEAITVAFEDEIGSRWSRSRVLLKELLFGCPVLRARRETHFRLPSTVDRRVVAFLISHSSMVGRFDERILELAMRFVDARWGSWVNDGFLELPQAQVVEMYRPQSRPGCGRENRKL